MEIPYTVSTRPDTGLWNAKIGIWLFLASEVMLFGGLFSAYIFLRIDAQPGMWPHGLLNVPVGTFNTAILIISSVTVVLAWAAFKMRRYNTYWWYMLATISCGVIFLVVKLGYEWPQKFDHFGAYIKPEALAKYEQYLGNEHAAAKGLSPRLEITGHLHNLKALHDPNIKEYEVALDPLNAEPTNPETDRPHFWPHSATEKIAVIEKEDVQYATMFLPKHSAYFASYFTITGSARGPRARWRAGFHLHVVAGQQAALPAQSGAFGQPRRSRRSILALCRSNLDFRIPTFLSALAPLMNKHCHVERSETSQSSRIGRNDQRFFALLRMTI